MLLSLLPLLSSLWHLTPTGVCTFLRTFPALYLIRLSLLGTIATHLLRSLRLIPDRPARLLKAALGILFRTIALSLPVLALLTLASGLPRLLLLRYCGTLRVALLPAVRPCLLPLVLPLIYPGILRVALGSARFCIGLVLLFLSGLLALPLSSLAFRGGLLCITSVFVGIGGLISVLLLLLLLTVLTSLFFTGLATLRRFLLPPVLIPNLVLVCLTTRPIGLVRLVRCILSATALLRLNTRRRHVLRVLLFHFLLELFAVLHALPAMFDLGVLDLGLNLLGRNLLIRFLDRRRGDNQLIAIHPVKVAMPATERADVRLTLQGETLNRTGRILVHAIEVGPMVIHNRVVIGDVSHVHGPINDRDVLLWLNDPPTQDRFADIADVNKVVVERPNIKCQVDLASNGVSFVNAFSSHWRQRRPADVITARPPGDPRWPPFVSGHPDPPVIDQLSPAPIVIGRPAKVFIGHPGPARIGIDPISICVGTPIRVAYRHVRLKDIAIVNRVDPTAIGREVIVEKIERNRGLCLGARSKGQEETDEREYKY